MLLQDSNQLGQLCTITCSRVVGILNVHDFLRWIGYILLGSTRKGVILK